MLNILEWILMTKHGQVWRLSTSAEYQVSPGADMHETQDARISERTPKLLKVNLIELLHFECTS